MEMTAVLEFLALGLGFYMAWNIGANDVANAMGTSVGSKALTIGKAVLIAAILEFSGAFFAGSNVSETIQKGIISPEVFQSDPRIFVLGMIGCLLSTGILLQIASYFALPVSTTHAIVGSVIGFGVFAHGIDAVHWGEVGMITLSWVLSPVLSGIIAFSVFTLIEKYIIRSLSPRLIIQKLIPCFVFLCFSILSWLFFSQGLTQLQVHLSFGVALSSSICVAGFASIGSSFLLRRIPILVQGGVGISRSFVEKTFVYLQILSACLVAFAHGANDVSNAIGPVAAILTTLKTEMIGQKSNVPSWLLCFGGVGMVVGLATWGWRVIETIGKKITELTPTRGFAAEFGAAFTVLLASKMGLPISTTHALVGAVFGVGLVSGLKALNLSMFKNIVLSWVVTLPLCSLFSVCTFFILKSIFI
jgi:inorganic phosphate transporter, PiT family